MSSPHDQVLRSLTNFGDYQDSFEWHLALMHSKMHAGSVSQLLSEGLY